MANNIVYAPVLAATLPACTPKTLIIPFTHNPAVSIDEVKRFYIVFKDINTSKVIHKFSAGSTKAADFIKAGQITYTDTNELSKITPNTSYKVQLAYVGEGQTEDTYRYSTAGIIRCVNYPSAFFISKNKQTTFEDAEDNKLSGNINTRLFTGVYNTATTSEVVYEYRFFLRQGGKNIETTGWLLHNSLNDQLRKVGGKYYKTCFDYFEIQSDLTENSAYSIYYEVRTVNSLQIHISSSFTASALNNDEVYRITIGQTPEARENGYLDIQLDCVYNWEGKEYAVNTDAAFKKLSKRLGDFVLRRCDSTTNFKRWDNLINFTITTNTTWDKNLHWIDSTIESGITYKYALSRLIDNKTVVSSWQESNKFTPYFEHMFLADNEKQLCLRFNPQVSSIKRVTQESKLDTIGGKYPFFFKNGDMYYTEIPISGLVTYLMDKQELFILRDDIGIKDDNMITTNLENYNITAERQFKFKVLDWLNNGKAKYFRSATEGNFIIRTLNNSMSPNTQLGRMLHTVTSTGDEVAENTVSNLITHNVLFVKKIAGRVEL